MSQDFYTRSAAYYDAITAEFDADIACYRHLAEAYGGPLLDVGCGTGRLLLPLAQAGYTVVGVDNNPAMLAIAREKTATLPRVTLHEADIMTHQSGPYGLVLLSFNALLHFTTQAAQRALLAHLAKLVAPEGALVIDIPNAGEAYATEDTPALMFERTITQDGQQVQQFSTSILERASQLLHTQWIYDDIAADGTLRRWIAPLTMRHVFPAEAALLLELAGLDIVDQFGDYDLNPFDEGCERLVILAEHRA